MSDTSGTPHEVLRPDAISSDRPTGRGGPDDHEGAGGVADVEVEVGTEVEAAGGDDEESAGESVTEPGKVMRIGSMIKQLLEEVRSAELDDPSRERLAEVYDRSITELTSALSDDLSEELRGLALPFDDDAVPSDAELRVAKAQLVGWLEGLFHGIQASLMAQQFAAQQQLQQMRELPGQQGRPGGDGERQRPQPPQTGTYL